MRQAITTKYIGPSNTRPARISVKSASGHRIIATWDDNVNETQNHAIAAEILIRKLGWYGEWFAGGLGKGNVYVMREFNSGQEIKEYRLNKKVIIHG